MKKKIISSLIALAFSAVAAASETIKIKFSDLAELGSALRSLDGTDREIKTSDQGSRIIRVPLDLKPAVRIAIARDLSSVRTALDGFESQRQVILQRISPGAIEKVQGDPALIGRFATAWNALISEPVIIDVVFITEEQLNLEANKEIGGTVLAGLAPILAPAKK